jgi:hypothetical protein
MREIPQHVQGDQRLTGVAQYTHIACGKLLKLWTSWTLAICMLATKLWVWHISMLVSLRRS